MTSGGLLAARVAVAEQTALHDALTECEGDVRRAAARLGVSLRKLHLLIGQHGYPDLVQETRRVTRANGRYQAETDTALAAGPGAYIALLARDRETRLKQAAVRMSAGWQPGGRQ